MEQRDKTAGVKRGKKFNVCQLELLTGAAKSVQAD